MQPGTIVVRAIWDAQAEIFVATSADVAGLVAEGVHFQALQPKLAALLPELLALNGAPHDDGDAAPDLGRHGAYSCIRTDQQGAPARACLAGQWITKSCLAIPITK